MYLAGRVAVVTGGNSGIGLATARAFGREGAKVAITYHADEPAAARAISDLRDLGAEACAVRMDLGDAPSIEAAFSQIASTLGAIEVLVANAIAWPGRGAFVEADLDAWLGDIAVNVEGTARTIRAVLPGMRASGGGRIVVISTGSAEEGGAGASAYLTAKSALHGLARTLAWEGGADHILVNVIAAGFTVTDKNLATIPDAMRQSVAGRTPSARLSTPDDVATLAVFLGSFANTNLTGEIIREGSSSGRSAHTR